MPDGKRGPARVRSAALRNRDRRRLRSGHARSRARARARAAGTSRCSPPARAITTPGATSTSPARPPSPTAWWCTASSWSARSRSGRAPASRRASSRARAVPLAEQLAWLDGLFRVPDLFHHLVVNSDRYDAVILSPYLFWTTVTGATHRPRAHDRDAVPARRAVRAPRGAQPRALRRRAPVVPLRARARARARAARRCPSTS